MRSVLVVAGALAILLGTVWGLQGAGYLQGSFMSNDAAWLWIGVILAVLGVFLLGFGLRPSSKKGAEPPTTGSRTT